MRKISVALGAVLAVLVMAGALWLRPTPPPAPLPPVGPDFAHWAVVLVAGDYRAHSGAPSKVFDNARGDLARAFKAIGFAPANMAQFSVDFDPGTRPTDIMSIASTMQAVASRARAGCLIYFTSHGTPDGIIVANDVLSPASMAAMVDNACGRRPAVIVMSSCYSGQFVPALASDNRLVLTAARLDRTSFGCGEMDHYTFFDDCFLRALPMSHDFPQQAELTRQCVAVREEQMKASPPSEPQLSVGRNVLFTLNWK